MAKTNNWEPLIRRMELLMRLKSFPVGFKMLTNKDDLSTIAYLRRPSHKVTLCQLISQVRNADWTVGADLDDFIGPVCPSIIGLCESPPECTDGTFRSIVWTQTRQDAIQFESAIQRLPMNKYEAVALAPLVYNPFDPDIVLIYANPAQMMLLINALQFENYQVMEFFCVGESSCSDAIARCYLTQKPSLTIPCYGERRYGHASDDELVMAIPTQDMTRALKGLEVLYRRGIRYPVSTAGAELDLTPAFPGAYSGIDQIRAVRGNDRRLLLGVTGTIASGKTTVAQMLADRGAYTIDFDQIARQVVEPGQQAYTQIVDYFGKQVLQKDKTLHRQKLSDIVFCDLEKRKKLESFTHPQIALNFVAQLEKITQKDPDAIIQVVVPLMIEQNLQYLFHKLLVVYIPQDALTQRLMKRNNIAQDEALKLINSQISIDEKRGYADFVIDNGKDLDFTQKQVDELWDTLINIQKK
ncbi:MAG: dephospho-CoA kinase [Candidatus Magnetoglobus multicellularis str. Araruama]|uniref:Dephospho-CoA kinase n=1 Tax=Candidatus Magnetoglobus multicellularis str. Araruama TaxID=890399 RepID=A0A1V1P7L1_9BACT|nr:MAG: dephospho-CoA kinase [Candidatus Magnetoglobus multicellularis str. Araruama]